MPQVVILPHVIEQKLKVNEREEVIHFINELLTDTSSELKKDVIEVTAEKFERRLSEEILNLKLELTERIADSEKKMIERIADSETRLSERISNLEVRMEQKIGNLGTRQDEKIATLTEKMIENKAEILKWMFIFWLGNIITIIGGIVGILKIAKVF
ncbi:MAG: hypothetical protein L0Y73_08610 [Candidatus Aminicenantes bacterium]|nr:hypothetical protein [Candidatus Aminicenantes bacterium]